MEHLTSVLIGVGLAMDAFTVSLGISTGRQEINKRSMFRLAFHFGIFQMGMTIVGWFAGNSIVSLIQAFDHWVAMALLAYVGGKMIRSGLNPDADSYLTDPSRGRLLVILSVATSIDALAVGLSMAMIDTPWLLPSIIIGVVTLVLSGIGLMVGDQLGKRFGKGMEILGGLILLGIGIRILVTHLFLY
jgi:putative Mn2+ efflux pump MntP